MNLVPSLDMIKGASERIKPYVNRTPILTSLTLN